MCRCWCSASVSFYIQSFKKCVNLKKKKKLNEKQKTNKTRTTHDSYDWPSKRMFSAVIIGIVRVLVGRRWIRLLNCNRVLSSVNVRPNKKNGASNSLVCPRRPARKVRASAKNVATTRRDSSINNLQFTDAVFCYPASLSSCLSVSLHL